MREILSETPDLHEVWSHESERRSVRLMIDKALADKAQQRHLRVACPVVAERLADLGHLMCKSEACAWAQGLPSNMCERAGGQESWTYGNQITHIEAIIDARVDEAACDVSLPWQKSGQTNKITKLKHSMRTETEGEHGAARAPSSCRKKRRSLMRSRSAPSRCRPTALRASTLACSSLYVAA
jgi:hypothetical protein